MKLGITNQGFQRLAQATGRGLGMGVGRGKGTCTHREMLKEEFDIDMDKFRDQTGGGRGDRIGPSDFPLDQIKMGVEVEKEHTDDPYIALGIALDHLIEYEDYYTALDDMEEDLEKYDRANYDRS